MPQLGDCISSIFEPGNIPTTSGTTPIIPALWTLYEPRGGVLPETVVPGFDFSKWYNTFNLMAV